jgi:hypothetical protein
MVKELLLVPLFELFIKESRNGRRRKHNGERIKPQTVENYTYVLKLLQEFEDYRQVQLRITVGIRNNQRLLLRERTYWKDFYHQFSDFLYRQKNCYDNFVGSVFKKLKCLMRYLRREKYLALPEGIENFYVRKEDIRVISLLPGQFSFLIGNKEFEAKLSHPQKRCKNLFVFGCTADLRYSDLMNLLVRDVEYRNGHHFLVYRSIKTDTPVSVILPGYALNIYEAFAAGNQPQQKLFPRLSIINFNKHLRRIGALAGWTGPIGKFRTRNGLVLEQKRGGTALYRFCDQLSSHTMRRTGITLLLMLGVPEFLVRKISGHAAHSRSFSRYVHVAQSYITDEITRAHKKLLGTNPS